MARTAKNKRCPLQAECGKKCEFINNEINCSYYEANGIGDNTIPDQEAIRAAREEAQSAALETEALENIEADETEAVSDDNAERNTVVFLPLDKLHAHPDNPRKDLGDLTELADSIKVSGVLQNLTVVPWFSAITGEGAETPEMQEELGYTIVIGHRRHAAAKLAGITELPCVIVNMTRNEQVATMLLENIQRSDLTAYEQACGFQMMLDLGETVDTVATKTGFSKSTVRRRLKLTELDKEKLKSASERQVTLFELDKLSQIKNIVVRNRVLDTVGTNNFENEFKKAISAQELEENKEKWRTFLTERGFTEISEKDMYDNKYIAVGQFNLSQDTSGIDSLCSDDKQYYFVFAYGNWVYLRTDRVVTEENPEDVAERERKEAERRERRTALEEATKRAFELRFKFISEYSSSEANLRSAEITSMIICRAWTPGYYYGSNEPLETYAKLLGASVDGQANSYDLVSDKTEARPELALLFYAYSVWNDNKSLGYFDYNMAHRDNSKLDKLYSYLEILGYELSDEEISLRDGTNTLFVQSSDTDDEEEDDYDDEYYEDDEDFLDDDEDEE